MRRLVLGLFLLTAPVFAQENTLTTPVTRSTITKVVIEDYSAVAATTSYAIKVQYRDASNVPIPPATLPPGTVTTYNVPSLAGAPCTSATTSAGLAGAMNTTRSGETGGALRIQQFRMLGYLSDQGCLPAGTLVP